MNGIDKALIPLRQSIDDAVDFVLSKVLRFSDIEKTDEILKRYLKGFMVNGRSFLDIL